MDSFYKIEPVFDHVAKILGDGRSAEGVRKLRIYALKKENIASKIEDLPFILPYGRPRNLNNKSLALNEHLAYEIDTIKH